MHSGTSIADLPRPEHSAAGALELHWEHQRVAGRQLGYPRFANRH